MAEFQVLMAAFLVEVFLLPGRFASFCLFALALGPMCCFWRPRFDCGFVWKKQSFKFPFPFPLSLSLSLSLLRLLFRSLSCAVAAFCLCVGALREQRGQRAWKTEEKLDYGSGGGGGSGTTSITGHTGELS